MLVACMYHTRPTLHEVVIFMAHVWRLENKAEVVSTAINHVQWMLNTTSDYQWQNKLCSATWVRFTAVPDQFFVPRWLLPGGLTSLRTDQFRTDQFPHRPILASTSWLTDQFSYLSVFALTSVRTNQFHTNQFLYWPVFAPNSFRADQFSYTYYKSGRER